MDFVFQYTLFKLKHFKKSSESLQKHYTVKVPGASIHFSDGGGGAKLRKISNISARSARAEHAAKLKIVYVLVVFLCKIYWFCSALWWFLNLFLHYILWIFQVVEIIGGGGGGRKTICLPPNIFMGGGGGRPPPAPQDRRLWEAHMDMILFEVFLKNIHLIPQDHIVQWHYL